MIYRKWTSQRGGVNRLIAILLALVGVLLILIALPAYRRYKENAEQIGCTLALKKAQDMMAVEYLFNTWHLTRQEAAAVVDRSRYGRDELCPGGGDYFIVRQGGSAVEYKVVCGLHDADTKERTRLCSGAALSRLLEELERVKKNGGTPKDLKVSLNGKKLSCKRVEQDPGLLFGTSKDIDRKGIVCYYALMGDESYREALEEKEKVDFSGIQEGEVWYFGYADTNHASVWKYGKGWSAGAWRTG